MKKDSTKCITHIIHLVNGIAIIMILLYSCKTTYIDNQGRPKPTWNTIHMRTVHKKANGFYAGGKWIEFKRDIKKVTAK